jgi:hypothetical protein
LDRCAQTHIRQSKRLVAFAEVQARELRRNHREVNVAPLARAIARIRAKQDNALDADAARVKISDVLIISKVLTLLLSKGKITPDHINLLKSWKHSGFQVFCGPRIQPRKKEAMENLARYIIRASFSQERMTYLPEESRIIYRSKDNRQEKIFDALDWLAAMASHIPDQREQMVRYGACPLFGELL